MLKMLILPVPCKNKAELHLTVIASFFLIFLLFLLSGEIEPPKKWAKQHLMAEHL